MSLEENGSKKIEEEIIKCHLIYDFIKKYTANPYEQNDKNFSKEVWGDFTNNECILDFCKQPSIGSHLYPKGYLLKNGKNFVNSTHSKLLAKSLKTPLFCHDHDNSLFKISDNIDDFTDFFKDSFRTKIENYFLKMLFFKYKTLIIQLNFLTVEIISQGTSISFHHYRLLLKQYQKINTEIVYYNKHGNSRINVFYIGIIGPYDSKGYTLFTNICFLTEDNVPFGLIFNQDKGGITLGICTYGEFLPSSLIFDIKKKLKDIKDKFSSGDQETAFKELVSYINAKFETNKYYNRTLYLNRECIDIGLYNTK